MMTLLMCAMFCQVKEIRSRCNIGSIACVNFLFCPMSSDWACVSVRVNVSSVPITFLLIFPVSRIHCVHCPSVEIVSLTGRFHVKHHFSNLFIGTLKKLTFCELYFCPFLFVFSPNRLSLYCFWNIVPVCNHHSVFFFPSSQFFSSSIHPRICQCLCFHEISYRVAPRATIILWKSWWKNRHYINFSVTRGV